MEAAHDKDGNVHLVIEDREETLAIAYAVSQARRGNFFEKLPFRRKGRLVRALGEHAAYAPRTEPLALSQTDSKLAASALKSFSELDVKQNPGALVHPESAFFVGTAAELITQIERDTTAR